MAALMTAVRQVAVALPDRAGLARFGAQLDVRPLPSGAERRTGGVAGYLAKYSVKGNDDNGALDRRVRSLGELRRRTLSAHHRRLAETAWRLGGSPAMAHLGLQRFAHSPGFRGHWMTKSRAWSTTFAALRAERATWRTAHELDDVGGPPGAGTDGDSDVVVLEASWTEEGRGWADAGEEHLARSRARAALEARRERWLALIAEGPPPLDRLILPQHSLDRA